MDIQPIEKELEKVLSEIRETLAKSNGTSIDDKADKDDKDELKEQAAVEGAADEKAATEGDAKDAEQEMAEKEMAGQAASEGEGDPRAELAAQAEGMSDEELSLMLELLQEELAKRQSKKEPAAPVDKEPEMAKMAKSMEAIAGAVERLTKEVAELKASKAAPAKTVAKPATANRQVQVLNKSVEPKRRLSKSETLDYLIGQLRSGDKRVNRDIVAEINATKDDAQLAAIQDKLVKQGFKFPEL